MITKDEREKDKAICEAATPGPWIHEGGRMVRCKPGGDTVPARTTEDAAFIVAARIRLPAYIADAEEMERRIADVEREADWFDGLATRYADGSATKGSAVARATGLRIALRILRGGQ